MTSCSFSALLRAENSERCANTFARASIMPFSALLRAENSEISERRKEMYAFTNFQCSSASRKFRNVRAEITARSAWNLSVLFCEPKIPKFTTGAGIMLAMIAFSALLRAENSEIRQGEWGLPELTTFQCSSASRKFRNLHLSLSSLSSSSFQCSSASRKFRNFA